MIEFLIKDGILIKCKSNISSAVIPKEVKEISREAFLGITKLKTIQFPDGLTTIGKRAFSNCYLLTEVRLPKSLVTIENGAFDDCVALDLASRKAIHSINPFAFNLNYKKGKPEKVDWRNILDKEIEEYVYCIDANTYKLLYINDSLLNKLSTSDYLNKKCYELFFKQDKPCLLCKKDELRLNESIAWYNKYKIEENTFLIRSKLFEHNNLRTFTQSSHKINGHLDKFNFLEKMAVADKTVIDCAKTIAGSKDLNSVIDKLLKLICNYEKAECVFLFEIDFSTNRSNLTHIYKSETSTLNCENDYSFDINENSEFSNRFMESDYIYLTKKDLIDNPNYKSNINPFVLANEFENMLIIPLKIDGVITGFITSNNMNHDDERFKKFSTFRTIAMFLLYSLSMKYSNDKLEKNYQKLKGEVDANQLMFKCSQTLLNSKDFDISINELLALLREFFDCSRMYIFKLDETTNSMFDWFEQLHLVESNMSELFDLPSGEFFDIYENFNKDGLVFIQDIYHITKNNTIFQSMILDDAQQFAFTTICKDEKIFGYLVAINPKKNTEELRSLKTISLFITNHIEKTTLVNELEALSYTDKLTDLYNRNFFNDYTKKMEYVKNLGIIFADVNSLKLANDKLGHEYGDLLIRCCAKVLSESINGFCFRLGGDEFIIFCEHIREIDFQVNLSILDNMMLDCGDVHISIGASWCSFTSDVDNEIKKADEDMYQKKELYYKEKAKDQRTPEKQLADLKSSIDNLKVLFNL